MITVDTNVLVRFLINDDAAQHQKAKQLFLNHPIYVLKTVLLEAEWVLRGAFELPKKTVEKQKKGDGQKWPSPVMGSIRLPNDFA